MHEYVCSLRLCGSFAGVLLWAFNPQGPRLRVVRHEVALLSLRKNGGLLVVYQGPSSLKAVI